MLADFEYCFFVVISMNCSRDLRYCHPFTTSDSQKRDDLSLQIDNRGGSLLPGFDTRLMVCVDVDECRVEPDSAFKERD